MIDLKAMCLFRHEGKILVSSGHDTVKNQVFYRLLGGYVEFGETAEAGIRREIQEELGSEIENLKLLGVIENIFTYQGKDGHEINYLFEGELANKALYAQSKIRIKEQKKEFDAEWLPQAAVMSGAVPLYPPFDYQSLLA